MNLSKAEQQTKRLSGVALIAFSCLIASCVLAPAFAAQSMEFCAKALTSLSPTEKQKLAELKTSVKGTGAGAIWTSKSIPYYLSPKVAESSKLVDSFNKAKKTILDLTGITLVKCNKNILAEPKVEGFIYVGPFDKLCKNKDAAACARVGMQKKKTASGLPGDDTSFEAKLAESGGILGIQEINTEYDIMHEILHSLGFRHAHQTPVAKDYIKIKEGADAADCAADPKALYLPHYDPSSIMHYGLHTCKQMELECERAQVDKYGRQELKKCAVDKLLNYETVCLYSSKNIYGDKCFQRPISILNYGKEYANNDFGQERCLSALDQAVILAMYDSAIDPVPIEPDKYGLADLVSKGICEK